jgi:hypothetical protein
VIDPCCDMMEMLGRDHYRGVPESELPSALIEIHGRAGAALLRTESGEFDTFIYFCPWCAKRIGKDPSELPLGFDPTD